MKIRHGIGGRASNKSMTQPVKSFLTQAVIKKVDITFTYIY
jgi:hypothetical protein